ncbi:MEKHLA domain-containing protein [Pseudonocardia eucalypti]|uniref:MEKHLA domain-containing protein n=1 Tax=Pseudonocardia eucalypti TaxID=648755 RepID=A0ABP9QNA8_9PSEU|nr:PAS domain S-box-containing protein [Pseudonocardia eucalypti]
MGDGWEPVDAEDPEFAALLVDSHLRVVGRPLVPGPPPGPELARWLYRETPVALLAHRPGADPRFCYANRAAQRHFGYDWAEFVGLPSRLSAADVDRAERARLLSDVARDGFSDDYRGLRVAKSGSQFWIENATVWNLVDAEGRLHGQAAAIRSVSPA